MLRSIRSTALAFSSALVLTCAVTAQAADKPMKTTFGVLDPDNDGTLDLAEIKTAAEAKFAKLEKDNDGTLDKKEVKALAVSSAEWAKADPDKDGTLDKAEFVALAEARFKAADPDNDGTVSAKEAKTKAGRALMLMLK